MSSANWRSNGGVKREGVSVFVNFVSKRIHPKTLREAFEAYGRIVDVFIAYNNAKRLGMRSTFAFVRFTSFKEALLAVEKANNRIMDGFKLKVYLENKSTVQRSSRGCKIDVSRVQNFVGDSCKAAEGRSFKDVLLGNFNQSRGMDIAGGKGEIKLESLSKDFGKSYSSLLSELIKIVVDEKEKAWLKNCLLKVWLSIEGLPLEAWSESVLHRIGRRWGKVIRLDPETLAKSRLDKARILLGINCLSIIPPFLPIEFEGPFLILKLSYSEFEDDRCWINDEKVNSVPEGKMEFSFDCNVNPRMGNSNVDGFKKLASYKDLMADSHYEDSVRVGKKCEELENISVPSLSGPQELLDQRATSAENLFEVQVEAGSESLDNSGISGSVGPNFDSESGLFNIKPKLVRHGNQFPKHCTRPKPFQWSVGVSPRIKKFNHNSRRKKANQSPPSGRGFISGLGAPSGRFASVKGESAMPPSDDPEWVEAVSTLEVCEALGIHFNADRQTILEKLLELEKNVED
ncbi:hypothetical protein GQ457_01G031530 [Hibiscus cannabinus]